MKLTVLMQALLVFLTSLASCTPKELIVGYHACAKGKGCHVMDQVTFHDSHILLLAASAHHRKLQGRLVDLGAGCPLAAQAGDTELEFNSNRNNVEVKRDNDARLNDSHNEQVELPRTAPPAHHRHPHKKHRGELVGLVRCGKCSLAAMLREAARSGMGGVIVSNAKECGQSTDMFVDSPGSFNIPVAFVSDKASQEIAAMGAQISKAASSTSTESFVYVLVPDESDTGRPASGIGRVLVIMYATVGGVVLVSMAYFTLFCSLGPLAHLHNSITATMFMPQTQPLDEETLEKLPLVAAEWTDRAQSESHHVEVYEAADALSDKIQQQLAGVIQRHGTGSYSFTSEQACAICLDPYVHNACLRVLPCRHAFHKTCIDAWLMCDDITFHCPICKASIYDGLRDLDRLGYGEILRKMHADEAAQQPWGLVYVCRVAAWAGRAFKGRPGSSEH